MNYLIRRQSERYKINRDITAAFDLEDAYYRQEWINNFWNDNYIEYERYDDRNKILSLNKYLNRIALLEGYNNWSSRN